MEVEQKPSLQTARRYRAASVTANETQLADSRVLAASLPADMFPLNGRYGCNVSPFGMGSDGDSFVMDIGLVYPWFGGVLDGRIFVKAYSIKVVGSFTCTLGTGAGIAGAIVDADEVFADAISVVSALTTHGQFIEQKTGHSIAYDSPDSNLQGSLAIKDANSAHGLMLRFRSLTGATAANAIVAPES